MSAVLVMAAARTYVSIMSADSIVSATIVETLLMDPNKNVKVYVQMTTGKHLSCGDQI